VFQVVHRSKTEKKTSKISIPAEPKQVVAELVSRVFATSTHWLSRHEKRKFFIGSHPEPGVPTELLVQPCRPGLGCADPQEIRKIPPSDIHLRQLYFLDYLVV
jgi:hypothetical protein